MTTARRGRRWLSGLLGAVLALPLIAATDVSADAAKPSDPLFNQSGVFGSHSWGVDQVRAYGAWDTTRGAGVTVAVVDSGVDLDHPDLVDNVIPGIDFARCPQTGCGDGHWDPNADGVGSDHGTHVAGTIGAVAGNGIGIFGVAPEVNILPVRVLDDGGSGGDVEITNGIRWAVDHGADVINMSLSALPGYGHVRSTAELDGFRAAIDYASQQGVIVVASAGNDSLPLCNSPGYLTGAMCVISTDINEARSFFSSGGVTESVLDIVAGPGGQGTFCDADAGVLSTVPDERPDDGCPGEGRGYDTKNGTSMASPHVAGVAALLVGAGCDREQAMAILRDTARHPVTDARGVFTPAYGWGIVDAAEGVAAAASRCTLPADQAPVAGRDAVSTVAGVPVTIDVLGNDGDGDGHGLRVVETTTPSRGTATHDDTTITYTPDPAGGPAYLWYRVVDATGRDDWGRVDVSVPVVVEPTVTITTPADGATVPTGPSEVSGALSRPSGGTLHLVGDGSSQTTADGLADAEAGRYSLSSGGHGDAATEHTTVGPWGVQIWEDSFVPTFVGDEPVQLSGGELTLTVPVEYRFPLNGAVVGCPLVAQLFTATDGTFAANGAEASASPETFPTEVHEAVFTLLPAAGTYDALGIQVGTIGVDCGTPSARWTWGTDELDGRLELAEDDVLLNGPVGPEPEIVEVALDGGVVDTVPADTEAGTGSFASTVDLDAGTHTITATWYDATGAVVGTDEVTVVAEDGDSTGGAPEAVDDEVETRRNVPVEVAVLANDRDPDGDPLTVVGLGDPVHGSVTTDGATVTYTPRRGYAGLDVFTYTVSDGQGGTDTAQVMVHVAQQGGPPDARGGPGGAGAASAGAVTQVIDALIGEYLRLATSGG